MLSSFRGSQMFMPPYYNVTLRFKLWSCHDLKFIPLKVESLDFSFVVFKKEAMLICVEGLNQLVRAYYYFVTSIFPSNALVLKEKCFTFLIEAVILQEVL